MQFRICGWRVISQLHITKLANSLGLDVQLYIQQTRIQKSTTEFFSHYGLHNHLVGGGVGGFTGLQLYFSGSLLCFLCIFCSSHSLYSGVLTVAWIQSHRRVRSTPWDTYWKVVNVHAVFYNIWLLICTFKCTFSPYSMNIRNSKEIKRQWIFESHWGRLFNKVIWSIHTNTLRQQLSLFFCTKFAFVDPPVAQQHRNAVTLYGSKKKNWMFQRE